MANDDTRPQLVRRGRFRCTHKPHQSCINCAIGVFRSRPATAQDVARWTTEGVDGD